MTFKFNISIPSIFGEVKKSTDTEKQLLFGALAKENKMWDAEKMEIVELKYIPKVGDCVKCSTKSFILFGKILILSICRYSVNSRYM